MKCCSAVVIPWHTNLVLQIYDYMFVWYGPQQIEILVVFQLKSKLRCKNY